MPPDAHALVPLAQVREVIGEESPAVAHKVFDRLGPTEQRFLAHAPFALLATASADGVPDVSPKGDGPGFVHVEDERTLLVPERKGNRMILGLRNLVENPRAALISLVPGTEETLRVHGRVELTRDPAVLARLAERGQPALLAIRLHVERCFFHCAKAFRRSHLWQPDTWPERVRISFGELLAPKFGGDEALAARIDESIEDDYRTNL
jgi:PPOX class probable FMN-dependent enzyme